MLRFSLLIFFALLSGCSSITSAETIVGTYLRVPTVHDEPSGKLVLSSDGRFTFLSVIPQTVNPATGGPFFSEDSGSWLLERGAILLHSDKEEDRRLRVISSKPTIELEWSSHIFMKKEPNQTLEPTAPSGRGSS